MKKGGFIVARARAPLKIFIALLVLLSTLLAIPVFAGTGSLRIDPPWPQAQESPAYFEIWSQPPDDAYDPSMFLAMTKSSWEGLTGDVTVSWTGSSSPLVIGMGDWTLGVKDVKLPTGVPEGVTNGAGLTVASLQDHLSTEDPIYWAWGTFLDGPLTGTPQTITVTISSDNPRMLVYLMGKSDPSGPIDMRTPPTIPGLVVPEVPYGTIGTLLTMLGAFLVIYTKKLF